MTENKNDLAKGIRVRTLNLVLILLSCILYVLLVYATVHAAIEYKAMVSDTTDYIECEKNAALVSDGSDYLTHQVQQYAVTMEPRHVEQYFEEVYKTQRREKALKHMEQYPAGKEARGYLEDALESSDKLMKREIYAMKLITTAQGYDMSGLPEDVRKAVLTEADRKLDKDAMLNKASDMVFGSYYQGVKKSISENLTYFLSGVVSEIQNKQQSSAADLKRMLTYQRILISALLVLSAAVFLLIIRLIAKPLRAYGDSMKEGKALEPAGAYELQYLAANYNDMYERNEASQEMMLYRAQKDPLTGLISRESFEYLTKRMNGMPAKIALLIIDIDEFEAVSRESGAETGEAILKKAARLIEKSFRTTDFPARIGRDEFAVILTDVVPELKSVIRNKVNAINKLLQEPSDGLPAVSVSAGGAFSQQGYTKDLYRNAREALNDVKDHGRCGCSFFGENK